MVVQALKKVIVGSNACSVVVLYKLYEKQMLL